MTTTFNTAIRFMIRPFLVPNRDRGKPLGFAPPTPPGIRITYLGGSVDLAVPWSSPGDWAVLLTQSIGPEAQTPGPDSGLISRVRAPTLPCSRQDPGSLPACAIHDIRPSPTASKDNSEGGVLPMNPAPSISICFRKIQSTPSIPIGSAALSIPRF